MFAPVAVAPPPAAVINRDDEWGRRIPIAAGTQIYWYACGPMRVSGGERPQRFSGLRFEVRTPGGTVTIESPLVGHINVYNILCAFCCGVSFGIDPVLIARGVSQCPPCRADSSGSTKGSRSWWRSDYAHTDDAIRNVIAVARSLEPKRVITLFGCGGDRDRTKRPLMGKAAAEGSDFIVLTSDNPRSEDPMRIIEDVLPGIASYSTPRLMSLIARRLSVRR